MSEMVKSDWSDAELSADLDRIDAEVKRRKKATPFEPFASWAYVERTDAIRRHAARTALGDG